MYTGLIACMLHCVISFADRLPSLVILMAEYIISRQDFSTFQVTEAGQNSEITFCLKEFKAILSFCEAVDNDIYFFYDCGGKPILLSNSADGKAPVICLRMRVISHINRVDFGFRVSARRTWW